MPNKAPRRLTNPRDTIEHNTTHCYGSSLPSIEAMLPVAPTSHSSPSTEHPPADPKQTPATAKANARDQSSLPSSSTPQRAAPTSKHEPTPRRRLLQPPAKPHPLMDMSLTTCRRCQATPPCSSSDFTLQEPASTHQPGAEKQAQPPKETSKPRRKSKTRRLHEGSDADGAAVTRFSLLDERARGENDAPNRESGANRRHHRQGFRPKKPSL